MVGFDGRSVSFELGAGHFCVAVAVTDPEPTCFIENYQLVDVLLDILLRGEGSKVTLRWMG